MEPNDVDLDQLVADLVSEILAVADRAGELDAWATERLNDSINDEALDKACTQLAEQFLTSDPPQTGAWEHLLVTLAIHSCRSKQLQGMNACQSMLRQLRDFLVDGQPKHFNPSKLMVIASAMTVVLASQYRLTQDIEVSIRQLCERFPEQLPEIAEQCQDIWKRRGQETGRRGLFVWDVRQQEWRLAQDFNPHRPSS